MDEMTQQDRGVDWGSGTIARRTVLARRADCRTGVGASGGAIYLGIFC